MRDVALTQLTSLFELAVKHCNVFSIYVSVYTINITTKSINFVKL